MVNVFIDSNVIANWIVIDGWYREVTDEGKKQERLTRFNEEIKKYSYQKSSYEFLEKLKINTFGHSFFVSELVLNEVTSVILEEYVSRRLISQGIPIRFWTKQWNKYKEDVKLEKEDEESIKNGIRHFIDAFIGTKNGNAANIIRRVKEKYDRETIFELIISYKVDSHDSSIAGIAVANECEYLITEDKRLIEKLNKNFKKIKLIRSEDFRLKFLK